jgi:hypothetical protein
VSGASAADSTALAARRRGRSRRGLDRVVPSNEGTKRPTRAGATPPGQLKAEHEHGPAAKRPDRKADGGRGPVEAPPRDTPVRRGPPESSSRAEQGRPAPEVLGPDRGAATPDSARPGPKLK